MTDQTPTPAPPAADTTPPLTAPAVETATPDRRSHFERLSDEDRKAFNETGELPTTLSGKPARPAKPAAAPADDDAPAVDARTGQPVVENGRPLSKREQRLNERIREGVESGTAQYRAEIDRLKRELETRGTTTPPAAQPGHEDARPAWEREQREPLIEDFVDQPDPYLALTRAVARYEYQQLERARQAEREAASHQQSAQEFFTDYHRREAEFKATTPDFDVKTAELKSVLGASLSAQAPQIERVVATEIVAAGPQMLLHLAEHPELVQRIGRLIQQQNLPTALRELGKIEASLTSAADTAAPAPPKATPPQTAAPAPPTVLGKRPGSPVDPSRTAVKERDFSAFDAAETDKDLARFGGRR